MADILYVLSLLKYTQIYIHTTYICACISYSYIQNKCKLLSGIYLQSYTTAELLLWQQIPYSNIEVTEITVRLKYLAPGYWASDYLNGPEQPSSCCRWQLRGGIRAALARVQPAKPAEKPPPPALQRQGRRVSGLQNRDARISADIKTVTVDAAV